MALLNRVKRRVKDICFFFFFACTVHPKERIPLLISVALPGSGRGHNQANNKISSDQITSALVVNDTAKFGAPLEPRMHI